MNSSVALFRFSTTACNPSFTESCDIVKPTGDPSRSTRRHACHSSGVPIGELSVCRLFVLWTAFAATVSVASMHVHSLQSQTTLENSFPFKLPYFYRLLTTATTTSFTRSTLPPSYSSSISSTRSTHRRPKHVSSSHRFTFAHPNRLDASSRYPLRLNRIETKSSNDVPTFVTSITITSEADVPSFYSSNYSTDLQTLNSNMSNRTPTIVRHHHNHRQFVRNNNDPFNLQNDEPPHEQLIVSGQFTSTVNPSMIEAHSKMMPSLLQVQNKTAVELPLPARQIFANNTATANSSTLLSLPSASASSSLTNEPSKPDQFYIDFLQQTRFWVQRVLSPIVIVVGVIGNGLTIIVMTRKRMRSSTNCYLAALASVDLAYLLFTFALSLKHYPGWRHPRYAAYWHSLPVLMMLADACTNISVWLTATFTLERFVVVSHPIRGKVICTESRARKTCAAIFTFCLLFVLPTPFEWTIMEQVEQSITSNATGNSSYERTYLAMYPSEFGQNQTYKSVYYWLTAVLFIFIPVLTLIIFNTFLIRSVRNSRRQRTQMTQSKYTPASARPPLPTGLSPHSFASSRARNHRTPQPATNCESKSIENPSKSTETSAVSVPITSCSSRSSSPGDNQSRTTGIVSTAAPNRVEQQSAKQETKITIMLISVVFLFLICQLPVACSLIYTSIRELDSTRNEFYIVTTINNIINLMVAVNAAGNFVLYCLLSQKYRRTLFAVICPCFKPQLTRLIGQNMTQTVVYSTSAYSQRQTNGTTSTTRRRYAGDSGQTSRSNPPPSPISPIKCDTFGGNNERQPQLTDENRLDASKLQPLSNSTGAANGSKSVRKCEPENENTFSLAVPRSVVGDAKPNGSELTNST